MPKRVVVTLTRAEADAVRWMANIGLRYASDEGPYPATIEAAKRGLEALTRGLGMFPYRRGENVYGRLTHHESSRAKH